MVLDNYNFIDENMYIPPFENYRHEASHRGIALDWYYSRQPITEAIDPDEGYGNVLRPVFIVLIFEDNKLDEFFNKFVKGQTYWHAAIGFGPSLKRTYSFNWGESDANKFKGGLSFESLDIYKKESPTGTMEVSCVLLDKDRYDRLKDTLEYYIRNKEKTRYDFINLARSYFGIKTKNGTKPNLVCSTFVDTILKSVKIDLNGKRTNLVKPDDLKVGKENKNNGKQFKVFEGKIVDYDVKKVTDKVDKLTQDANNKYDK